MRIECVIVIYQQRNSVQQYIGLDRKYMIIVKRKDIVRIKCVIVIYQWRNSVQLKKIQSAYFGNCNLNLDAG